jgi:hypothetical protein
MGDDPSAFWPACTLLVGLVALVAATRGRRGWLLSPFSLSVLTLCSIFGARPLFMLRSGDFSLYGLNTASGFNEAAALGTLALVSVSVGYAASAVRPRQRPERLGPDTRSHEWRGSFSAYCVVAAMLITLWFVSIVAVGGASLLPVLFGGRSQLVTQQLAGVPALFSAAPAAGAVLVSLGRIRIERVAPLLRRQSIMFWLIIAAAVIPPAALGTRRFLLPCLLAALIATVRPRFDRLVNLRIAVGSVLGFVALAVVPFVRSAGSRNPGTGLVGASRDYISEVGVGGAVEPYFLSYDTEMFNYVSYLAPRLGTDFPYGYGRGTIVDFMLNPLPASLTPTATWSDQLLTSIFGGGCATVACPVPSMVGVLLYDLGVLGVLIGCLLAGAVMQRAGSRLRFADGGHLGLILTFAAFTPVLVRGNTTNVAYLATMTFILVAGGEWIVRTTLRSTAARARAGSSTGNQDCHR